MSVNHQLGGGNTHPKARLNEHFQEINRMVRFISRIPASPLEA